MAKVSIANGQPFANISYRTPPATIRASDAGAAFTADAEVIKTSILLDWNEIADLLFHIGQHIATLTKREPR